MPINTNFVEMTANNELTDQMTTEGRFRTAMTTTLEALGDANERAVAAIDVRPTNNVSPIAALIDTNAENNPLRITSNIVVGTANPPAAGTDFQPGQIYFTIE